mmetsp:Transcript_41882/g.67760  ORF Transcript_41882/g.67760 Transcript_41882/m.67760 type:complete len:332 (-) Transcript_41882:105-1100(-)
MMFRAGALVLTIIARPTTGSEIACKAGDLTCEVDSNALMQVHHKKRECPGGDASQCNLCSTATQCLCNPNWAVACTAPGSKDACTSAGGTWCTDIPTTTPGPPAPPVPSGALMGEWSTCYPSVCPGSEPYPDSSIKICFTGSGTFQANQKSCARATSFNYLSIGGGPGFIPPTADEIKSLKGYDGISLDIESYAALDVDAIQVSLQAAKDAGLKTHFTCAHTGYGLTRDFVMAVLKLPTLDYVSPQLYTTTPCIQATESAGITWADWKTALDSDGATAQLLPGVPEGDFQSYASYDDITNTFCTSNFGKPCPGVMVWPTTGTCTGVDRVWP